MPFILCLASGSRSVMAASTVRAVAGSLPSKPFRSHTARTAALSTSARKQNTSRPSQSDATEHQSNAHAQDPLRPDIPLSGLQLPLDPLPPPIPSIRPSSAINRETLHRLHRLSALNPPAENSEEETQLIAELNGLVGLMDLVKDVQLPEGLDMAGLLSEGRGEILLDGSHLDPSGTGVAGEASSREAALAKDAAEAEKGRELLEYATKTTGEYYSSKTNRKL